MKKLSKLVVLALSAALPLGFVSCKADVETEYVTKEVEVLKEVPTDMTKEAATAVYHWKASVSGAGYTLYPYASDGVKFVVADAYKDDSGNWTLTVKNSLGNSLGFSVYLPFVYTNEAGSTYSSPDQFIGKTFNLKGIYSYHKSSSKISYQIVCRNNSEFTEVK